MKPKIVLAGGTGFIGSFFQKKFADAGYEVVIISREANHVSWKDDASLLNALEGAAVLVNLAGKSVNCRYTAKNKKAILDSRVDTTRKLQQIADQCKRPPQLWINSSTATIYRHAEDRAMDEATGEVGSGFSVAVAQAWEKAFFENEYPGTRKIALRIAIVLGKTGGVMKPFTKLVRFGLGGKQGNGKQMFSWIHIEDLYQIVLFLMNNKTLKGIYNCSAPSPVTNQMFMGAIRKILRPLLYLPSPIILLKAGAILIGTETELLLKSRWVLPGKLLDAGYRFRYPNINAALNEIYQKQS
ncbi:TIGR01777 family oxidoreductase [Niabella yanshanensis]|uniref:TIGR01777 family oxidoreductase n=1 Tax=Niabella yanshanensis TaxID=577386 RepID=A0ABZ0WA10_9BACT|nr:TIGR01777 family oxidoreductase [Niabella yanshanensis]WQD39418.1 TIGR01777 family oxidoreductase [Niabella yanshanensis]